MNRIGCFAVPCSALVLLAACTGAPVRNETGPEITAVFTSGINAPNQTVRSGETTRSCIVVDDGDAVVTFTLTARDTSGLASMQVVSERRTGEFRPGFRIASVTPGDPDSHHLIQASGRGGMAWVGFNRTGEGGDDVQISALATIELTLPSNYHSFDNPASLVFEARDLDGNLTRMDPIDLRRPRSTGAGAFVCMNGTGG